MIPDPSALKAITLCAFADEADADRHGQIKALTENGIPYLEIRGVDGTNIASLTRQAALQFKSELDAAGIRVWSIGSPAGKSDINADFAPAVEQFKYLLEMADIFEAKRIR
ncbi:MAG: sugar phosphate isomerase/epimerase, partial [Clostridia bacterium]|nr:sugar phosphate isomerase/epimerase [Clostridia bacterium]